MYKVLHKLANFFLKRDVLIAGVSVFTTLFVTTFGAYLGYLLTERANQSQRKYENFISWQEKRYDLIQNLIEIIGLRPAAIDVWDAYQRSPSTELSGRLGEYNASMTATFVGASMMFGSTTQLLVADLQKSPKPWWEVTEDELTELLNAMVIEFNAYGR